MMAGEKLQMHRPGGMPLSIFAIMDSVMMLRPNPARCGKWRAGVPTPGRCAYWTPRSLNEAMTAKTFSSCYPVHYPKIAIKLTSH